MRYTLTPCTKARCNCGNYRFIEGPSADRITEALVALGWSTEHGCARCTAVAS
jgi:hypothetical protein